MNKKLTKVKGIFARKTTRVALVAALKYAEKTRKEKNIVIIIPDTGERYLSIELWD